MELLIRRYNPETEGTILILGSCRTCLSPSPQLEPWEAILLETHTLSPGEHPGLAPRLQPSSTPAAPQFVWPMYRPRSLADLEESLRTTFPEAPGTVIVDVADSHARRSQHHHRRERRGEDGQHQQRRLRSLQTRRPGSFQVFGQRTRFQRHQCELYLPVSVLTP